MSFSEYTVYDFVESVDASRRDKGEISPLMEDISRVLYAHGVTGDVNEWNGGFCCELKDGSIAYIWGWCDTTGWGCQDGGGVETFRTIYEFLAYVARERTKFQGHYTSCPHIQEWDVEPEDLNRYLENPTRENMF